MAQTQAGTTFTRHVPLTTSTGGGGYGTHVNDYEDLTPWKPSAQEPWDAARAAHLFRRAGFGANSAELKGALAIGVDRTVDTLLVAPGWPIPSQGVFMLPDTGEIVNMNQTNGQIGAWLYLMHNSPFPLTEKLSLFWHDHFATGINKVLYANMMGDQINLFRRFGLRSFRTLLIEVSKDPAMLYWLDNRLSTKAKPNENYAREIFELFSMGVTGPYTENDVQEAARALTGFTAIYSYSYFNANNHDTTAKSVLGKQIANGSGAAGAKDLEDLVDIILGTPATSKYIVRKIWEYFVYEAPSQALIDQLAARWVQDKFDIRALMETIFRSTAFYSSKARNSLIKNPVEYMVGTLRQLGEKNVNYSRIAVRMTPLYALLNYDNPSGLPDGVSWIDSQALLNRSNYARDIVQQRNSYVRFLFSGMPYLPPFDVAKVIADNKLDTPTKIVDWFLEALLAVPVPATVRQNLITFMTSDNGTTTFQWNEASHAQRKGAGLIHLILALPEAQMN